MDTHAHVLNSGELSNNIEVDGRGYSEAIKGSNLTDSGVDGFEIIAGDEDGIDCVRGSRYTFANGEITGDPSKPPRVFITLKGGIDTVHLSNIMLRGKRRLWWDIMLGDHTIYNKRKLMNQSGIHLKNVFREDGKAVRILVVDSEPPHLHGGRYKVTRVPKFLVRFWMWIKG